MFNCNKSKGSQGIQGMRLVLCNGGVGPEDVSELSIAEAMDDSFNTVVAIPIPMPLPTPLQEIQPGAFHVIPPGRIITIDDSACSRSESEDEITGAVLCLAASAKPQLEELQAQDLKQSAVYDQLREALTEMKENLQQELAGLREWQCKEAVLPASTNKRPNLDENRISTGQSWVERPKGMPNQEWYAYQLLTGYSRIEKEQNRSTSTSSAKQRKWSMIRKRVKELAKENRSPAKQKKWKLPNLWRKVLPLAANKQN